MSIPLWQPVSEQTIAAWGGNLRDAIAKANRASLDWERRKAYLVEYCNANVYSEAQRREKFRGDWRLGDAMDAYGFWQRETLRWSAAIQAEESMRRMMGCDIPATRQETGASR